MPQQKDRNRERGEASEGREPDRGGGRGFAGMSAERQRQIASLGGKAAHQKGTAHEFTRDEARNAGAKGGRVAHERGTAHEFTPDEAREAGRKGGQASARGREPSEDVDEEDGE